MWQVTGVVNIVITLATSSNGEKLTQPLCCVTLSMEKRKKCKELSVDLRKNMWKNMDNLKAPSPSPEILMFLCPLCAISSRGLQPMAL